MKTESYYTWQTFETTLAGEPLRWAGKPGLEMWDDISPAARLLAEGLRVEPGQHVLDLRCGAGLCGALAARRGADVTLCDDSLVAVQAAQRTLALNNAPGQVIHGVPEEGAFDWVLLNAPRGREWVRHLLGVAARALKPGGQLLLAGPNRGGIKGYIEDAGETVGLCRVERIKASHRLAIAVNSDRPSYVKRQTSCDAQPSPFTLCPSSFILHSSSFSLASGPGVFSSGELDAGTRAMVETMVIHPGEAVLDLGCGSGIVGAVAAQTASRVVLVDSSAAALAASRATLELNGVANAEVLPSDCGGAVLDQRFDVVATNPPFHQGLGVEFDVARQFVRDAAQVLVPGGRLYLVANRFLRYEREMSGLFSHVNTVYEDSRFRVLEART